MHLIEVSDRRILLDCGMFQGHRAEANARNARLPFEPSSLTHVILSHAHIDHSGNLPTLVKNGYPGEILCTPATRDLANLMLRDSAKIQEQDAAYLNKKLARRGEPLISPLYTASEADQALRHLSTREYERAFNLGDGLSADVSVQAQFRDAGHILGSAIVVLDIAERGRQLRLAFSGDLGRKNALILRDPELLAGADHLIIESTYGSRLHPPFSEAEALLGQIVRETADRGGKVIIPAFAVERTQEVVYSLSRLTDAGQIPALPIFVDSPLAIDATEVFRLHLDCFDDETQEYILKHHDPFGFKALHYTRDVEESKKINDVRGPAVIISANGMAEAGRVLHHLKNNIEDERATVLFVGFQAENTLGRRLLDGVPRVRIFGDEYRVRAHVASAQGFSTHADRDELLAWVKHIGASLKGVFVVHGEPESAQALAEDISALGVPQVVVPEVGQHFEL
jgi:metallo-beta-lactamase family protein